MISYNLTNSVGVLVDNGKHMAYIRNEHLLKSMLSKRDRNSSITCLDKESVNKCISKVLGMSSEERSQALKKLVSDLKIEI